MHTRENDAVHKVKGIRPLAKQATHLPLKDAGRAIQLLDTTPDSGYSMI